MEPVFQVHPYVSRRNPKLHGVLKQGVGAVPLLRPNQKSAPVVQGQAAVNHQFGLDVETELPLLIIKGKGAGTVKGHVLRRHIFLPPDGKLRNLLYFLGCLTGFGRRETGFLIHRSFLGGRSLLLHRSFLSHIDRPLSFPAASKRQRKHQTKHRSPILSHSHSSNPEKTVCFNT